jgi:Ca2+-dependent lipid-binding protein
LSFFLFICSGNSRLVVEVVAGRNLAVKDLSGTSDPYCILCMGKTELKTNIIEKNLDPVWNEEFFL